MDKTNISESEIENLAMQFVEHVERKGLVNEAKLLGSIVKDMQDSALAQNALKYCLDEHLLTPLYSKCARNKKITPENTFYIAPKNNF